MERYDLIVVGAGPAGAAAARSLSDRGLSVLVMERRRLPRAKPCAGWVSPWVFELIGVTPEDYAARATLVSFCSLIVWDGHDRPREVAFDRIMGYGIIRSELDAFLVSRIINARIIQETAAVDIRRGPRAIVVNERFTAPVIIGAGGHRCPVAVRFGRIDPTERYVTAVVSETRLDRQTIGRLTPYRDVPQVIFNDDFSGYGWFFPKGDYLNVGVGTTAPARLGAHRDSLMARLAGLRMLPDRNRQTIAGFSGHAYKLMRVSPRLLCSDGVLLVGDAAGVAYNMSGEGIGPAIFSGLCAADTVCEAGGDYSCRQLARYTERLYARLGSPYPDALIAAAAVVPGFLSPIVRRLAVGNPAFRRHVVARRWFFRD